MRGKERGDEKTTLLSGIHSHSHLSHRPQQSPDHNHLSSDDPHLQSLISTHQLPFKYTLPTDTHRPVYRSLPEQTPDPAILTCDTYLPDSPAILLCFPIVVPGSFLIPALRCSCKERTLISIKPDPFELFLYPDPLPASISTRLPSPYLINHSVVSLTCCFCHCL